MKTAISRIVHRLAGRRHAKHATTAPVVPRARLWRRGVSTAALAALSATALVAQGSVLTDATWNDSEWVNSGTLGTLNCADPNVKLYTRGEGRLLSGSLLGINLDTLAEASGVEVTNNSERSKETRNVATALGNDAYANPLNVTALSTVNVNLGKGLLQLPLNNNTGVIGQYGQAESDGHAVGASGLITNSGGIATAPGNAYPELANLNLKDLLNASGTSLGDLVSNVSDLELSVGAVAGRASLNGCESAWGGLESLKRDYLTANLNASIDSPTVENLYETTNNLINNLQTQVNSLLGSKGVVKSLTDGLIGSVQTLLANTGALRVTSDPEKAAVSITAEIETAAIKAFLSQPIQDDEGLLKVDLPNGSVEIDLAALVGKAFHEDAGLGLNNLPPNTDPLSDEKVIATLGKSLSQALNTWITRLDELLNAAVDSIKIHIEADVYLQANLLIGWIKIGGVKITVTGSLSEVLQAKPSTIQVRSALLQGIPILGAVIDGLIGTLVTSLTSTLLAGVVSPVLAGVFDTLRVAPPIVRTAAQAVGTLVSTVYNSVLSGALKITINAQNSPGNGSSPPVDWLSGQPTAPPTGRYEVAAIRIGVVDTLGSEGVRLYLGKASVGAVCTPLQASQPGSPCTGY